MTARETRFKAEQKQYTATTYLKSNVIHLDIGKQWHKHSENMKN